MTTTATDIRERIEILRDRVSEAARRAGRDPSEITIVGVTKTVAPTRVREAVAAGLATLAENRVQEAASKIPAAGVTASWHLVGHLQSNKARAAVELFDVIQSVDSVKLASILDRVAAERGDKLRVLLQVNTSGEPSKHGFSPEETNGAFGEIGGLSNLDVRGLMTIGPLETDGDGARHAFERLRDLRERLQSLDPTRPLEALSMGMSYDLEDAITEGSTMIRVGRAIFGERI